MAETEGGVGGKARSKKIDQLVTEMTTGKGGNSSSEPYVPPKKKPPYTPSDKEKKSRQYGAPIQPPLTRMREGQSTDSNNKYA
jgi:hypothetical protein